MLHKWTLKRPDTWPPLEHYTQYLEGPGPGRPVESFWIHIGKMENVMVQWGMNCFILHSQIITAVHIAASDSQNCPGCPARVVADLTMMTVVPRTASKVMDKSTSQPFPKLMLKQHKSLLLLEGIWDHFLNFRFKFVLWAWPVQLCDF